MIRDNFVTIVLQSWNIRMGFVEIRLNLWKTDGGNDYIMVRVHHIVIFGTKNLEQLFGWEGRCAIAC